MSFQLLKSGPKIIPGSCAVAASPQPFLNYGGLQKDKVMRELLKLSGFVKKTASFVGIITVVRFK